MGNQFFNWLASQPAFVEVGVGIVFCLLIAPLLLALVAVGLTSLEGKLARTMEQSGVLEGGTLSAPRSWETLRRAVSQQFASPAKAQSKRQA